MVSVGLKTTKLIPINISFLNRHLGLLLKNINYVSEILSEHFC